MIQANQVRLNGTRVGVVFGSFAPLHQGHLDIIMKAKRQNDAGCVVVVSGYKGDRGGNALLEFIRRYRYVRELFADDPLIAVYGIDEEEIGIDGCTNRWDEWLNEFQKHVVPLAVQNIEIEQRWYVSEPDYQAALQHRGLNVVLCNRKNPISGTMIRQNPIQNWGKITAPFKRAFSTNILITGTASEGKTTLVQDLGMYYGTTYSSEWGRTYIEESCLDERELGIEDFLAFLEGQYKLNKSMINSAANKGIFFADTDSLVTEMYAEQYCRDSNFNLYNRWDDFKLIQHTARMYAKKSMWDHIFVCKPSKAKFVDDGVRYMGHSKIDIRNQMYNSLLEKLHRCGYSDKITILQGDFYQKFTEIKKYVDGVMINGKY